MSGTLGDTEHDHQEHQARARRRRRSQLVFWGFAAIAGVLLFTEHRMHVLGLLPYLFLLACPLMHMFHHGHGGHHHHHRHDTGTADTNTREENKP